MRIEAYLEIGSKRVFAGALDWPGWCRSGRDEDAALEALAAYGARYAKAVKGLKPPRDAASLEVVERLKGDASTDFGAPGAAPERDGLALDDRELKRLAGIIQACWSAFDGAARKHARATLRKGPRGGGRDLDAIVAHVYEADKAYLSQLGGAMRSARDMNDLRAALLDAVAARAHGEAPIKPKRSGTLWTARYGIRRSAWHALDHAWEIEDRAG